MQTLGVQALEVQISNRQTLKIQTSKVRTLEMQILNGRTSGGVKEYVNPPEILFELIRREAERKYIRRQMGAD